MQEFLERVYHGNTIQDYLIALGITIVGVVAIRIFRKSVLTWLKKWVEGTETNLDDYFVRTVERFGLPVLNFISLYIGISYLDLNEFGNKVVYATMVMVISFYALRMTTIFIRIFIESHVRKQGSGEGLSLPIQTLFLNKESQ